MGVAGDADLDRRVGRKSATNGRPVGASEWRGFINVDLTAAQKTEFDDWVRTDDPWLALAEAARSGCQVGLKYMSGESCFMSSITQRTVGHVNAGLCVTARASTADKSLLRVLFLYRILGSEDAWEKVQRAADPDRW